jgi:hypothetical protein
MFEVASQELRNVHGVDQRTIDRMWIVGRRAFDRTGICRATETWAARPGRMAGGDRLFDFAHIGIRTASEESWLISANSDRFTPRTLPWLVSELAMPRPLLLIHGYSATGLDFTNLYWALVARKIDVQLLNVGNYLSLNNEITIEDIAEGLQRAISLTNLNDAQEFDAIVHSTGMLVVRAWLAHQNIAPGENQRLKQLKHLIGVAPATWGSPQAHKGRSWLGALVKGSHTPGPDFMNAGNLVLEGLELGSRYTWDLAHADLLGPKPYFGTGPDTPYVAVFIGNTPYTGIASVANDPGTDGTVRWSGCGLNTRKITLDLTRTPTDSQGLARQRVTMSEWANDSRLNVPMLAVDKRDHGRWFRIPTLAWWTASPRFWISGTSTNITSG